MYSFFKIALLWAIINTITLANTEVKLNDKNSYQVLCYHNVVDKITDPKVMNITTDQLIAHFKWLKVNGYHVINIDDILKAKRGEKDLPQKAVLLTFDDGYVSFYTRIYPLLKLYNYHAIYALVGKWQETPEDQTFLYGTLPRSRKMLLSWEEIKEMMTSGLVEFASHTYDSHHGILANPQGNTQPALTAIKFDKVTKRYESTQSYISRVENDIKKSSYIIYKHTGFRPRVIAWPYGAYNGIVQKIAKKYGMPITLTLDDGINTPDDIAGIKRILVKNDPQFGDFYWNIQENEFSPQRSIFINIDDLYDTDPKKTNKKLGRVINRIKKFNISAVIIKAYSDTDNDNLADMLYFPNKIMPMRADLLNRISWQLKSRSPIEDVFVQMPLSAFEIKNQKLSLYKANDQKKIMKIYSDMAKYSFFKGIVFDKNYNTLKVNTDDTIRFTNQLLHIMRDYTIELKKSIMIDAKDVTNPDNHDLAKFLNFYDYTFLNTQYLLANTKNAQKDLKELVSIVKNTYNGLQKSAFILADENHSNEELSDLMQTMLLQKAMNFGYQPKHILNNNLNIRELTKVFSLKSSPFE